MLKSAVRLLLACMGWQLEGTPPAVPRYVTLGVPHTSIADFFLMVAYMISHDLPMRWLGKASLFTGPFGGILRRLGGVPVDRSRSHHLVDQTIALFAGHEPCVVCIAPEGTRRWTPFWKTGFYYIALGAGVPIALSYVDAGRRRVGIGPLVYPSGDIESDMAIIADFYKPIAGVHPERQGPVCVQPPDPVSASPKA